LRSLAVSVGPLGLTSRRTWPGPEGSNLNLGVQRSRDSRHETMRLNGQGANWASILGDSPLSSYLCRQGFKRLVTHISWDLYGQGGVYHSVDYGFLFVSSVPCALIAGCTASCRHNSSFGSTGRSLRLLDESRQRCQRTTHEMRHKS